MNSSRFVKPAVTIIGKEGSTRDGDGFIGSLWEEANACFFQVEGLARRDAEGNILRIWGAMSDFSRSFRPWEDNFSQGLYLAGVECRPDAQAPEGWVKWVLPAWEYLCVPHEGPDTFPEAIQYLRESDLSLVGAVQEMICPQTGESYLLLPIARG